MEFSQLPKTGLDFISWDWEQIKPYFDDLAARPFDASTVDAWLADWNRLAELIDEAATRLYVATSQNTDDADAEQRYAKFNETIRPPVAEAEQALKDRLLTSRLEPAGFDVPLAKMRLQAEIFRTASLPLLSEELQLGAVDYYRVRGAETIEWEGETHPLTYALVLLEARDRPVREQAFRLRLACWLNDRAAIDEIWLKLLNIRSQIAENAGEADYRAYRWKQMLRLDYTPEDTLRFHEAVEKVVVPAAVRLYEKRRQRLGLDVLQPWDTLVDQFNAPPLKPFQTADELESKTAAVFQHVDPELGRYFTIMREEKLLDLDIRMHKAPGGFMLPFEVAHRPFIFFSAVGIPLDVETLLHEGGHAFHTFEMAQQPYIQMRGEVGAPSEFQEVASMAMELLAFPYVDQAHGGFYTPEEFARARCRHLEGMLTFWPYMSVMDSYQHWVYTHLDEAMDITACDAVWKTLWDRFMKGVNWAGNGVEEYVPMRWRAQGHLFDAPFYYIEYGLAQLGAVQVWGNALKDQAGAVAQYRSALRLGGSKRLPELYEAAGVKLAFDAETLKRAVDLIEEELEKSEAGL